jgi:chorismate dehydratase
MSHKIRIGAVSYLNTKPLVYGLQHGMDGERLDLSYDVPAVLTRRMTAGELDIALLPVIALGDLPDLELVPGLGITTYGPSLSVLLLANRPLSEVRSVALDEESRTSNALTRLLFSEVWGSQPRFERGPRDAGSALTEHDAVVRIGDKALFEPYPAGVEVYDLGQVWTTATGLPFVFAAWAARPGIVDRDLYETLHASCREGRQALDRIAEEFRWHGRRNPELARRYLDQHIHYSLDAAELQAIRRFLRTAARLDLIDREPEILLAAVRGSSCDEVALGRSMTSEESRR